MSIPKKHRRILVAILPLASLFAPQSAHAFAEDICFAKNDGGIVECAPLPAACQPVPTQTDACYTAAIAATAQGTSANDGGRSSVHVDATYVLALAAGFPAEAAYWIAAYDEVTDLGSYEARDRNGIRYGNGAYKTAFLDGVMRTNISETGGIFFHFNAPRNRGLAQPVPGIDGLHPDSKNAATEVFLAHLRSWAFAKGAARPECTGGFTVASANGDYATGNSCFTNAGAPGKINARITAIGNVGLPFTLDTGSQVIVTASAPGGLKTAEAFDSVTAPHAAEARIGLYLHALADRVSHHVCGDISVTQGPGLNGTFAVDLKDPECAQGPHALRHMWETGLGTQLANVAAKDQTTAAALGDVYDELIALAAARGYAPPPAAARTPLLNALLVALMTPGAVARVDAVTAVGCARGFPAMPGLACPTVNADGGAGPVDAGAAAIADAGSDGAIAPGRVEPSVASEGNAGCALAFAPSAGGGATIAGLLGLVLAGFRRRR